jgi:hypothetical protein
MIDTTKLDHKLRMGLFWSAFFLAPLIWSAPAFGLLFLGVLWEAPDAFFPFLLVWGFALVAGYIPYVLFGGPIMWYWAARAYPSKKHMAKGAMVSVLISSLFGLAYIVISIVFFEPQGAGNLSEAMGAVVFYIGLGCPFAALWGATVSVIYQRLDRRFPVRAAD